MGVFAEMLAAAMNPNLAIGEHAAMYVEGRSRGLRAVSFS